MTYKPGELTKIADRARKKSESPYEDGSPEDIRSWHSVIEISGSPKDNFYTVKMAGLEEDSASAQGLLINKSTVSSVIQDITNRITVTFPIPISVYQRDITGNIILTDDKNIGLPV
ncbi:hypothetical protein LCGC14_2785790 [marine sediment metagenome]|uniref:Uncharacterized protein n=1 Tax=marine sediment metagenome TaxID=412755 RepID=A0A0F8ZE22_9ZZZZ